MLVGFGTAPIRIYFHGAAVPPFTLVCSIFLLEQLPDTSSRPCNLRGAAAWAVKAATLLLFWSSSALLTFTLPLEIDIYIDEDGNLDPTQWRHPFVDYYSSFGYVLPGVLLTFLFSLHGLMCTEKSKGSVLLGVAELPCEQVGGGQVRRLL